MYSFSWMYFKRNLNLDLKDLYTSNKFADVTLVSDDNIHFKAHKFLLGACSPELKQLLFNNPHPHPSIYLKDVPSQALKSILYFIYHGETKLPFTQMEKFFETGRKLQIKQLTGTLLVNNNDQATEKTETEMKNTLNSVVTETHHLEKDYSKISSLKDEYDTAENSKAIRVFKCGECKGEYKDKSTLNKHIKGMHGGVTYICDTCDYKAAQMGNLKVHKEVTHEGVRYSCADCTYKTAYLGHLKRHKESIHEGVRYYCNECEYKATDRGNLRRHINAKHEGVKFSCDECEYKTVQKYRLVKHKELNHAHVLLT